MHLISDQCCSGCGSQSKANWQGAIAGCYGTYIRLALCMDAPHDSIIANNSKQLIVLEIVGGSPEVQYAGRHLSVKALQLCVVGDQGSIS